MSELERWFGGDAVDVDAFRVLNIATTASASLRGVWSESDRPEEVFHPPGVW